MALIKPGANLSTTNSDRELKSCECSITLSYVFEHYFLLKNYVLSKVMENQEVNNENIAFEGGIVI
jgi:hypothetical protein